MERDTRAATGDIGYVAAVAAHKGRRGHSKKKPSCTVFLACTDESIVDIFF